MINPTRTRRGTEASDKLAFMKAEAKECAKIANRQASYMHHLLFKGLSIGYEKGASIVEEHGDGAIAKLKEVIAIYRERARDYDVSQAQRKIDMSILNALEEIKAIMEAESSRKVMED